MEKSSEIRSVIDGLCMSIKVTLLPTNQDDDEHDHGGDPKPPPPPPPTADNSDYVSTEFFLHASNLLILQVLDKMGPPMAVLRHDVHQNIEALLGITRIFALYAWNGKFENKFTKGYSAQAAIYHVVGNLHNAKSRLQKIYELDPIINANLVEILKKEAKDGIARKVNSCTRAMVWLTRSMDFTVALLDKLVKDPGQSMEQAVEESYNINLRPWHGWISAAAYKVALKLVPDRKTFMNLLMAKDKDQDMLTEDLQTLIALLLPLLDQIHSILIKFSSDKLRSA